MPGSSQIHATSPLEQKTDLLTFEVLVDGAVLPDEYNVQSINIHEAINKISTAELTILDGLPEDQDFGLIKKDEKIVPGAAIKIKLGYHSSNQDVFDGIVLKVGVSIKTGGYSEITAFCVHKAYFMTLSKHSKYYTKKKDSDIISSIISTYGLSSQIDATNVIQNQMIQYDSLDWDFIISRAEPNGLIVTTVANDKVVVQKPEFNKAPDHQLVYGVDIMKTELEVDGSFQLKKVKASSWDHTTQKIISATDTKPSVNSQGQSSKTQYEKLAAEFNKFDFNLFSTANIPQSELQAWASAQVMKSKMSRIKGSVQCHGSAKFKANSIVELKGVSKWFDGKAYISEVNHHVQGGNWIVNLTIGYDKDWFMESRNDVVSPPAANLMPAMQGLYIAKVTQLENDPDGDYRIKINIPIVTESTDGIWARLMQFHASNSHGSYYVPEKGDEVIVGFLHSDTRNPIILGSLYSAKLSSPYTHTATNDIKGFVSRSKLKLTYDEAQKSIALETPGGRKFLMDDTKGEISLKDNLGNSIVMDSKGITMNTNFSVSVKAIQNATIEGTAGVNVKSVANTNIEGAMIAVKGMANVDVSGALVNISAAGAAMVKGATVALQGAVAKIGTIIQLG